MQIFQVARKTGFDLSIHTVPHPFISEGGSSTAAQWVDIYTPNNRRRPVTPLTSLPKPVKNVGVGEEGGQEEQMI